MKKSIYFLFGITLVLMMCFSCGTSKIPEKEGWTLIWNDEFTGKKLDTTKWDYRLCMMGKRHQAWTDKGVKLENGCAVFSIFEEIPLFLLSNAF